MYPVFEFEPASFIYRLVEKQLSSPSRTCGTTPKAFLHVCRETELQETPSMEISPSVEARRSRAESRVLFPEPVRPSRPIYTNTQEHFEKLNELIHHLLEILYLVSLCACIYVTRHTYRILYTLHVHILYMYSMQFIWKQVEYTHDDTKNCCIEVFRSLKALRPFICSLVATISPFIRRP